MCLTTAVSQVGLTEDRFAYIHSLVYLSPSLQTLSVGLFLSLSAGMSCGFH